MVLEIVKYGDPVLRQRGALIEKITPAIRKLVEDMLDTMREAHGVGLAAQQVGEALQLTVIDVGGVEERPSTLELGGEPVDVNQFMPMVLINPEVTPCGEPEAGPEGCLSFPEVYADITRPVSVEVKALNEEGKEIQFRCGGLLARAVQHEVDHLRGILFIDRMTGDTKKSLKPELERIQSETKAALKKQGR
jgi:peptide deformylase